MSEPPPRAGEGGRQWSRILLARVEDRDDFDFVIRHAVDHDIVGVDYRLARALDTTGPVNEWEGGKALDRSLDPLLQAQGGIRVMLRDIVDNLP